MKRGEIYWIRIPSNTGHELMKDRPGIIVSRGPITTAATVNVVMCSASYKADAPEHITIRSTPRVSTAMCEHIYTVDRSRIEEYLGKVSEQEMQAVDMGIASALGLDCFQSKREKPVAAPAAVSAEAVELAVYKQLYGELLDKVL